MFVCCKNEHKQRDTDRRFHDASHDVSSLTERLHCPVVAAVFDSFFVECCVHMFDEFSLYVQPFHSLPFCNFAHSLGITSHAVRPSEEWCMYVTWKPCAPYASLFSAWVIPKSQVAVGVFNTQKCNYRMSFPFRLRDVRWGIFFNKNRETERKKYTDHSVVREEGKNRGNWEIISHSYSSHCENKKRGRNERIAVVSPDMICV